MQTLITPESIKRIGLDSDFFDIAESEIDNYLMSFIEEASLRLRRWVGESKYNETLVSNANEALVRRLKQAEYYLTLHNVLSQVFMRRFIEPKKIELGSDLEIEFSQITIEDKEKTLRRLLSSAEQSVDLYISSPGSNIHVE